jgi:Transposase DDE domain
MVGVMTITPTRGPTMSGSIVQAVARIKGNVAAFLTAESIAQACRDAGHTWRERELGPATTVWAFLLQVLHGNTSCAHVVRLAELRCSAEAYCAARARLPLAALRCLLERMTQAARRSCREPRWRGHRTFFVDGSGCSMPDTVELQNHFGQPGQQRPGCGFPQAHLLAMFDAATGLLVKMLAAPLRTHDQSHVAQLHPELAAGDVLVADRGCASYVHLALILGSSMHAVFRAHQRQLVSFRRDRRLAGKQPRGTVARYANSRLVRQLGRWDQVVEYAQPSQCPDWLDWGSFHNLPNTIMVRELRYRTAVAGFRTRQITLVTTLLDDQQYPSTALAELYRRRWEIETNFAHLKTTMKMDVLHCRSLSGVLKELTMFALVYNLVRLVMVEAARAMAVAPQRLSFVDALRWLAEACQRTPALVVRINPDRPQRIEPRLRKRRPKEFSLMKSPRRQLRQQLLRKQVTA